MAGWIKIPHGTEVQALAQVMHIVLVGDPTPPPRKRDTAAPHFSADVYCGQTVARLSNCWALVQRGYTRRFLIMLHTVVVKNRPRHFGTWEGTLRHLGQDSSALRSKLSLGHFGTSADLSGQFGPTRLVPKCPGSGMSWVLSVRNSSVQRLLIGV